MTRYSDRVIVHAGSYGIAAGELPLICNGCSGGLSRLYAISGRSISCEACCNIHDIDYHVGGGFWERWKADRNLRQCAARAGSFPSGWKGTVRRIWRTFRAWAMWAAVRVCGWYYWES